MIGASMAARAPRTRGLGQMAMDAIRRNGGTLLLPGAATPNGDGTFSYGNPPLRNYLDSAGTDLLDSVTQVDQPVGVCLDSMGVLGAELFTGAYVTGAATTATYVGNEATATFGGSLPATTNNWLSLPGAATANVYSEIEFWATYVSGGNLEVGRTWTAAQTITAASNAGVRTRYKATVFSATANASAGRVTFGSTTAGSVWKIELISVREIPGNHATQPTTASKPLLRRGLVNQLTQSDFQNGVADAPTRSGLVTASSMAGYGGALAFGHDGSTTSFAYKNFATTAGLTYTVSVIVRMDDGLAPSFSGPSGGAGSPFSLVIASAAIGGPGATVKHLGDDVYRVSIALVATGTFTGCGVIKYATNNSRTFKVTRYGLFQGTVTADQILAAGGIPLTTTAPASSERGRYAWQFDGSNDFLQTGITTGNEGWICAGVNFQGAAGVNETIFANGAGSAEQKGVWLVRSGQNAENIMRMGIGNGTALTMPVVNTVPLHNTPRVVEGGWTADSVFVTVDGTTTQTLARTGDAATPPQTTLIGAYLSGIHSLQGPMSATVYTPVLPNAADRALIRRFIGSLQGQQL